QRELVRMCDCKAAESPAGWPVPLITACLASGGGASDSVSAACPRWQWRGSRVPQLDPEFVSEALAAQLCSHRAMDAPKHYGAEVVLALANELRDEALAASPERVSAVCAKELRVQLRLRKDQTFEHFEAQLQQAVGRSAPMGRIWLPADEVVLGAEAGREVRRILLHQGLKFYERTASRSPLQEVAQFLEYKWVRELGPLKTWVRMDPDAVLDKLRRCRGAKIRELGALMRSNLP
ncbi:unnamed protein product, partial [Effrenium voratum]